MQKFFGEPLPELAPVAGDEEAATIWPLFWRSFQDPERHPPEQLLWDLQKQYRNHPNSRTLTKALAYFYLWRVSELSSSGDSKAQDDWLLVQFYFERLESLGEATARGRGWLGWAKSQLGQIHSTPDLALDGVQTATLGVRLEREFNYFPAIYGLSTQPADSDALRMSLDMAWKMLDSCAGESLDRSNPDFRHLISRSIDEGPERVCWDTSEAPHNFSGMFLFLGDLFLKGSLPATAKIMYQNAKLAPSFASWPYKTILEQRLQNAELAAQRHNNAQPANELKIMPETDFSCRGCHLHAPRLGH